MKKGLFFGALLSCLVLAGCASNDEPSTDSGKDSTTTSEQTSVESSKDSTVDSTVDSTSQESVAPVVEGVELTTTSLGIAGAKYGDGTATVDGVEFAFTQLGDYGNGIQLRSKDGVSSSIKNTAAFADGVKSIKIVLTEGKTGFSNNNALKIEAGNEAGTALKTVSFNTEKDVAEYTIDLEASYKFVTITHSFDHSLYIASITFVK